MMAVMGRLLLWFSHIMIIGLKMICYAERIWRITTVQSGATLSVNAIVNVTNMTNVTIQK